VGACGDPRGSKQGEGEGMRKLPGGVGESTLH